MIHWKTTLLIPEVSEHTVEFFGVRTELFVELVHNWPRNRLSLSDIMGRLLEDALTPKGDYNFAKAGIFETYVDAQDPISPKKPL
jgi:hypothetical protein